MTFTGLLKMRCQRLKLQLLQEQEAVEKAQNLFRTSQTSSISILTSSCFCGGGGRRHFHQYIACTLSRSERFVHVGSHTNVFRPRRTFKWPMEKDLGSQKLSVRRNCIEMIINTIKIHEAIKSESISLSNAELMDKETPSQQFTQRQHGNSRSVSMTFFKTVLHHDEAEEGSGGVLLLLAASSRKRRLS